VAETDPFYADPDPSFHFNADLDPTFHFAADPYPDPAPHLVMPATRGHCERVRPSMALF
jgi:hypothetical protein